MTRDNFIAHVNPECHLSSWYHCHMSVSQ